MPGTRRPNPTHRLGKTGDLGRSGQLLHDHWGLLITGAISLFAYGGLLKLHIQHGTLRAGVTPQTIAWYLLAFAAYLGAVAWTEIKPVLMRWIWITAILFRLLLLFTTPTLSDDIYRYLWDGHVANEGVSPYAYAINDPVLDRLAIPLRAQANNPEMASPYLPAAQWVFAGLAALFPLQPFYLQFLMTSFDLISGLLIARLLVRAALPEHRLALYLWNPLVVLEIAHGAHIDAFMILLTLAGVWFTVERLPAGERVSRLWDAIAAPFSLALATLTKLLPILLVPILGRQWSGRQKLVYAGLIGGTILPAASLAGWGLTGPLDGTGVFGALRIYGYRWKFNSGIFQWLEDWLTGLGAANPTAFAKWLSLAAFLWLCLAIWRWARPPLNARNTVRLAAMPFMAYLLLTPTVHPWYALILIAFLPFLAPAPGEPGRLWLTVVPWLYLSGALIFSYLTYLDPVDYHELPWVRGLEWAPTLALLLSSLASGAWRPIIPSGSADYSYQNAK